MAENETTTTKKPAARSTSATRNRSRSRAKTATANRTAQAQNTAAATSGGQDDWRALNRVVSRYLAGHPNASIGEMTVGELLAYAETRRPRTMTAGGAA